MAASLFEKLSEIFISTVKAEEEEEEEEEEVFLKYNINLMRFYLFAKYIRSCYVMIVNAGLAKRVE